jgi:ATP-dependent Zn protease
VERRETIHPGKVLVSYHEAAHCVVGAILGEQFEYAWIKGSGHGWCGYNHQSMPAWCNGLFNRGYTKEDLKALTLTPEQKEFIYHRIVSTIAAPLVEGYMSKRLRYRLPSDAMAEEGDMQQSYIMAKMLTNGDCDAIQRVLQKAHSRANDIIGERWSTIIKVASALIEREHLSGDQINKIVATSHGITLPGLP